MYLRDIIKLGHEFDVECSKQSSIWIQGFCWEREMEITIVSEMWCHNHIPTKAEIRKHKKSHTESSPDS